MLCEPQVMVMAAATTGSCSECRGCCRRSAQGCRPSILIAVRLTIVSATVGSACSATMPSVAQVLATDSGSLAAQALQVEDERSALAVVGFGDPAVNEDVEVRTSSVADDQLLPPVVFGVDDDGF